MPVVSPPEKPKNRVKIVVAVLGGLLLLIAGFWAWIIYNHNQYTGYPQGYPYTCDRQLIACGQTEDKGKDLVAQRPEVKQLVEHYGRKGVVIRALEYADIQDKSYVKRLLGPDYTDIGCIILVDYPGGRLVYLENDKLDVIRQLDGDHFSAMLATAPQQDIQKFYANLR